MTTYFATAVAAGLAVGLVNAYFTWRDQGSGRQSLRTFLGWLLAFVVTGLAAPRIAARLLTHVF